TEKLADVLRRTRRSMPASGLPLESLYCKSTLMLPSGFRRWFDVFSAGTAKLLRNVWSTSSVLNVPAEPYNSSNEDCWSGAVMTTTFWLCSWSTAVQSDGYCTLNGAPEPV